MQHRDRARTAQDTLPDSLLNARPVPAPSMDLPDYLVPTVDPTIGTTFVRVTTPKSPLGNGVACKLSLLHPSILERPGLECGPKPAFHCQRLQRPVLSRRAHLRSAVSAAREVNANGILKTRN